MNQIPHFLKLIPTCIQKGQIYQTEQRMIKTKKQCVKQKQNNYAYA